MRIPGLVILFLLLGTGFLNAQEMTIPSGNNPVLKAQKKPVSRQKAAMVADTLLLPFFDDFSTTKIYPSPKNWIDSFAYINDNYPVNPLSVGVATLDILNQYGDVYPEASDKPFSADVLTSKPINLKYPVTKNIYLSFYYQPQGLGDSPEPGDSLFVEFHAPGDTLWTKVWKVPGSKVYPFKAASIAIDQEKFLVKGFQFRFRNLGSNGNTIFYPGQKGNFDQWHIDYVKIDTGRYLNDTIMRDVAFSKPQTSIIKRYESIPWNQFKVASASIIDKNIRITYKNNDSIVHLVERNFIIRDLKGTDKLEFSAGKENVASQELFNLETGLEYPFLTEQTRSAIFEVKSFLVTDPFDIKTNDTIRYNQVFSNYYAYDDGTPEAGYGLSGQGAENGMVAYKFECYTSDTLYALRFFFNSSEGNANLKYFFKPAVWSASTSAPSALLYVAERADTAKSINSFCDYVLSTPLVVKGDFYIGWLQTSSDFLNVGMDLNRDASQYLYYNLNGTWQKTGQKGALMLRPVFGSSGMLTDNKSIETPKTGELKIYPNPTQGFLRIAGIDENAYPVMVNIIDISGRTVASRQFSGEDMDLSDLPAGMYLISIQTKTQLLYKGKIIIQK